MIERLNEVNVAIEMLKSLHPKVVSELLELIEEKYELIAIINEELEQLKGLD